MIDGGQTKTKTNNGVQNMQSSEQTTDLASAFVKAQAEMSNPKFDSVNPHFKSQFASLAAVRNAVIPVLSKHGICMNQDLITAEGTISCSTRLTHVSGQWWSFGPLTLPVSKDDPQGYASAGTYAKRVHMQAVCVVVGDDDDDGNSASGKPAKGIDPRGDMGKEVPKDKVAETVRHMLKLLDEDIVGDHEGAKKAAIVLDYHENKLNPDPDLYVAVGDALPAGKKNVWRALVSQAKKLEAAEPKGRKF
jgi:hypothetical protein